MELGELKVLVTGGAGFIGSHLVEGLLSAGYDVGVLDDFTTGMESNIENHLESIKLHKGSVADKTFVRKTVKGYDSILHDAARVSVVRSVEDPLSTNMVNSSGTLNLLTASVDLGVERFVYASSSSVYGETPTLPKVETMPLRPISPYAVSKLTGENYCKVFARVYGLTTISLRYFNVYGPRQMAGPYSGVIPSFTKKALWGEPPIIFGDGTQTRDFTHVKDVVQANLLCLKQAVEGGEVFNVGSHEQTSLNELAKLVCNLTGRDDLEPIHQPPRGGDISHSYADISKITRVLGYKPSFNIESGLAQVVQWFRQSSHS